VTFVMAVDMVMAGIDTTGNTLAFLVSVLSNRFFFVTDSRPENDDFLSKLAKLCFKDLKKFHSCKVAVLNMFMSGGQFY
jgi:hypothetical protein